MKGIISLVGAAWCAPAHTDLSNHSRQETCHSQSADKHLPSACEGGCGRVDSGSILVIALASGNRLHNTNTQQGLGQMLGGVVMSLQQYRTAHWFHGAYIHYTVKGAIVFAIVFAHVYETESSK